MKSIRDSYIYKFYDPVVHISKQTQDINSITDFLAISDVEENLNIINKRFSYTLKSKVMNELTGKNRIKLLFNKNKFNMPSSFPCFLYKDSDGKVSCIANLGLYGVKRQDGLFDIENRALYSLLQTSTIFLDCFQHWNSITVNQALLKDGALMYSKIFTKVLDKMFAVNLNSTKTDRVRFATAKFFLINIMEKSNSTLVDNIAYAATTGKTLKNTVLQFSDDFKPESYQSLDLFIHELSKRVDGLYNLTVREFLNQFMKMYGASTIFALDFFPFFCHMIFSSMIGAHFNNEYIIENVVGKESIEFYNSLAVLIK